MQYTVIFIVLLLCTYQQSYAQSKPDGNISGMVVNSDTHKPVENAAVRISESGEAAFTDSMGRFSITGLKPGRYTIAVRRLGFKPHQENIFYHDNTANELLIHLFPSAVQTAAVVVSGRHPVSGLDDLRESVNTMKGRELQKDLGFTLASTLKNETGMAIRSMGPAPARPVIRGLGGSRIAIDEDGINVSDLSATSPDHAVSVEPFTADRIEVIRGPRVLLKSQSAIGGIIDVIRNDIPAVIPERITGSAGLMGESSNSGYLGSFTAEIPFDPVVFRAEASGKRAGDMRTPAGRLKNSDLQTYGLAGGLGLISNWGTAGLSFREFTSSYGVPGGFIGAHPMGVDIEMLRRQINAKIHIDAGSRILRDIDAEVSRNYYRHKEFESKNVIGAEYSTYTYSGNLQFRFQPLSFLSESIAGLSAEYKDYRIGGYVFMPPSVSSTVSGYVFGNLELERLDIQLAFRYGLARITPQENKPDSRIGNIRERNFGTFSFSSSLLYNFYDGIYAGLSLNRTSRIPTVEELYSEGPHLAAYSYETGNPELQSERGTGIELFSLYKADGIFIMFTGFLNDMSYFIIPRNTGRLNYATLLPVYATAGEKVQMRGIETETEFSISAHFSFSASASYTRGEFTGTGKPLPSIPPFRLNAALKYMYAGFSSGISAEAAASQDRVDIFEEPTKGYSIFGLYVQQVIAAGSLVHNISFSIDNIFNTEYRNHLSRIKSILPEPGRNFRLTYKLFY